MAERSDPTGTTAMMVPVADLMFRPGARRHEERTGRSPAMAVVSASVAPGTPVSVEVVVEWVTEGILATGVARTRWTAECRRCLAPTEGEVVAEFRELFEPHPTDGETYPLLGDRIDLGPLAQEALTLALPLAPLCRPDCAGLCPRCGADLSEGGCTCAAAPADPRWAALDALRLDEN